MGLESVELVMSIEATFGIEIPDGEVATLTTPRKLIDYVCARLGAGGGARCASQRSFYRIRRILAAAAGSDARRIRPGTHLEELLSPRTRRQVWAGLMRELGLRRALRRPTWLVASMIALCGLAFLAALRTSPMMPFVAGLAAAACLGGLLGLVTAPFAVRVDMTAGDLARAAIPGVFAIGDASAGPRWTRDAVGEACRSLIREQLGLDEFSDDAEFIRDLGVD